jgi:hypothetical protein
MHVPGVGHGAGGTHFPELGGVCGMMTYLCNMCHNIMSSWDFNVIYATINITYCTL